MDFNEEELQEEQNEEILDNLNDEINENEPVKEPDSSSLEMQEAPIVVEKANTKKKNIPAIFKKGYFWISLGLALIIGLAAIFLYQMDWDLFGIGKPKPKYYQGPACGKVYLTWEDDEYLKKHNLLPTTDPLEVDLGNTERFSYEEYDYDTYISGIVWTDNKDAMDVDNEIVYQAMGIVARSRLISELPENCVVLRDYNEQAKSFTKLNGTEEKYKEITSAVQATKLLIISKDNQILNARYDTFSYLKKIKDNDEQYNGTFFYHMMNENKEKQLMIPASWVDKLEKEKNKKIPKTHVNATKKLGSLSLYGAKYLLEQVDSQYELYRILETFYGREIDYHTLDSGYASEVASGNTGFYGSFGCFWWPVGSNQITTIDGINYAMGTPASVKITSSFGPRGPVTGVPNASRYHKAIDIGGGNEGGTNINIIAAQDGTVIGIGNGCAASSSGCNNGIGNYVKIEHGNGIVTRYGHLSAVFVRSGDTVKKGQIIGRMGSTGNSNGVHLDFQVMDNETPVNPLNFVSPSNTRPENCGSSVTTIPSTGDNVKTTCLAYKQAGYTSAQTVGAMVNAKSESGFRPDAFNPSGGGQGAYGIFQWRGGRQSALKALKNYDTIEVQLGFSLSELNSSEANARKKLLETTTAGDAVFTFCKYYERPGSDSICNARKNDATTTTYYTYANNGCQ